MGEILDRIDRGVRRHGDGDDEAADAGNHQVVAVRRRLRGRFGGDQAGAARPVLHHDVLADRVGKLLRHQTAEDIGGATGRERRQHAHRPCGPILGARRRREQCDRDDCGPRTGRQSREHHMPHADRDRTTN